MPIEAPGDALTAHSAATVIPDEVKAQSGGVAVMAPFLDVVIDREGRHSNHCPTGAEGVRTAR
jgi:hypothetical protein